MSGRKPAPAQDGASGGAEVVPLRKARQCPICDQPSDRKTYPFCSRRCANIDLNRWLTGSYAIPASEEEPGSEDDTPR